LGGGFKFQLQIAKKLSLVQIKNRLENFHLNSAFRFRETIGKRVKNLCQFLIPLIYGGSPLGTIHVVQGITLK
jgi:hypothetical protein